MKRKTIVGITLGLLLIGIVSAGLVGYLSNMVSGSVEVEGPVFYLSDTEVVINGVTSRALNLNEFDGESNKRPFTGTNSQWFVTEELGIDSFYPAEYEFYIKACAENKTETDLIGQIDLTLRVLDSNGNPKDIICGTSIENIPTKNSCYAVDYQEYPPISCNTGDLNLNPTDRIVLIASDGLHQITYYIKMDGYSRIEVSAI